MAGFDSLCLSDGRLPLLVLAVSNLGYVFYYSALLLHQLHLFQVSCKNKTKQNKTQTSIIC